MNAVKKSHILQSLKTDILRLEGLKRSNSKPVDFGLGPISEAFPDRAFPLGAVHEFLTAQKEDYAATSGFIAALLSKVMTSGGTAIWISASRTLFPPALKRFGISPEHVIFIDLKKDKHVLWAVDEALKCGAVTAVIGELKELDFTASRRLQLAVEESLATGFILRQFRQSQTTTACVSRWRITSIPSLPIDDLPGVGNPSWHVELLRMRNGKTGAWDITWTNGHFEHFHQHAAHSINQRKAG